MNRCAGYGAAFALALLTAVAAAAAAAQESVLYSFGGGRDGSFPEAGLIADAKGVLYGTTYYGGDNDNGTVFALSPPAADKTRWTEMVLYRFKGGADGARPLAGLIVDAKGVLYGTTTLGGDLEGGTVFALSPPPAGETRWTETVLHRFRGGGRDGISPSAGLIADAKGVLYGTTAGGGDPSCVCGTVFALSPAAGETRWTETVLHRFRSFPRPDGSFPSGGLIADAKGVLYGTTERGGGPSCFAGCGTVFALSPPAAGERLWTERVLYSFRGSGDGRDPEGGLIADAKGVLYGTTFAGGTQDVGTVFTVSPPAADETGWTEGVLYSFRVGRDGHDPEGGLIADAKGVLYGTTSEGGNIHCSNNAHRCGTVFALSPPTAGETRWTETVVHRFLREARDGRYPVAGLIADAKGVLYGTTERGGTPCDISPYGCGTVFALSPPAAGETR